MPHDYRFDINSLTAQPAQARLEHSSSHHQVINSCPQWNLSLLNLHLHLCQIFFPLVLAQVHWPLYKYFSTVCDACWFGIIHGIPRQPSPQTHKPLHSPECKDVTVRFTW